MKGTPTREAKKAARRQRSLAAADSRMAEAKALFSKAALSCLRQAPDAAAQVQAALAGLEAARAELRQITEGGPA